MVKMGRILICLSLFFALTRSVESASLTFVSDLISSSAPLAEVDHAITFKVTNSIPAGGKIIITPEAGDFSIPSGMNYTDIDFLVSQTPDNYINRSIGLNQTSTEDGIAITTGTSGNITISLNTSLGISAGNQVKILIGNNAVFQETGDRRIINPTTEGSYRIDIRTENNIQTIIDSARTLVAIINQVMVTGVIQNVPPNMFNGNPAGSFSHTVTAIELWLNTDETANCKYSTISSISYSAMANTFSNTSDTLHRTVVSGLTASTSYNYYVKCLDVDLNETPEDLLIGFNIKSVPPVGTIPGPVGGPEGSGGPPASPTPPPPLPVSSSSGKPFPTDKATLLFDGLAPLSSIVHILKDGVDVGTTFVTSDSKFNFNLSDINRGVYTFGFYAIDLGGNKSNTSNATFSVLSNTNNQISNIQIPPTVKLVSTDISPGQPIKVNGFTIAKSSVELAVYSKTDPSSPIISEVIVSDGSGKWSADIDTVSLPSNTYWIRARSIISESGFGAWTQFQTFGLGVGKPQELNAKDSDLNGDSKTNLIDFSILLFNWGNTGGVTASDLNSDNAVNLTDFSILLFNWTG